MRTAKVVALASGLMALMTVPASGTVVLGPSDLNPNPSTAGSINYSGSPMLLTTAAPPGVLLATRSAGVITRWRMFTGDVGANASVQLRLFMPDPGTASNAYKLVASGAIEPIQAHTTSGAEFRNLLHTFAARIPISSGQTVGVTMTGSFNFPVLPYFPGSAYAYGCLSCLGPAPAEGDTALADNHSQQWLAVNADVEPDTDGDGFGDESQDRCPGQAGTDRGCPPGTLDPQVIHDTVHDTVIQVNTVAPGSASAVIDPKSVKLSANRRLLSVAVSCPDQQAPNCAGTLGAMTTRPVTLAAGPGKRRRARLSLGNVRFSIGKRTSTRVTLKLPAKTRTAIAKLKQLKITITLTESAAVGTKLP